MKDRKRIAIDGVFDIETENWDKFVLGGLYDVQDDLYLEGRWTKEDDFVDKILAMEGTIYAHNSGRFDSLWLLDHIARRNLACRINLRGAGIACLDLGTLRIRDSFAIAPMKLKDFAAIGGTAKTETALPCICQHNKKTNPSGKPCGGYCSISRKMSNANLRKLGTYCENDCRALAKSLLRLQEFCDEEDLDLCGTVGMSAWSTASRWLDIEDVDWGPRPYCYARYAFARNGYKGGRTQVLRPQAEAGNRYDINSAYPWALSITALPVGDSEIVGRRKAAQLFESRDGIYHAKVTVKEQHIPPLPVRTDDRVAYPTGTFEGWWTSLELRDAVERGDVEIENMRQAIVWNKTLPVLASFCRRVWKLRADLGKSHPIAKWLKWFVNSATGKLAQRPEHEKVMMNPEELPDMSKWCPLSLGNGYSVWKTKTYRMSPSAYVHWAGFLTSATRISLREQLLDDGQGGMTAAYCDTDSCYSTTKREKRIGKELGEWNDEGTFRNWTAIAPKTYRYYDEAAGEWVVKAKGIPEADHVWEALATGKPVDVTSGVKTFKTAIRGGDFFARRKFSRRSHADGLHFGDRVLDGEVTRAQTAKELGL